MLSCFYHGWGFGSGGSCVDVPTARASKTVNLDGFCAKAYAVAEQDGLLWIWRGQQLSADVRKLPTCARFELMLPSQRPVHLLSSPQVQVLP